MHSSKIGDKSMVCFLATKVLIVKGRGPTLVDSPLLALMRDPKEAPLGSRVRAHE